MKLKKRYLTEQSICKLYTIIYSKRNFIEQKCGQPTLFSACYILYTLYIVQVIKTAKTAEMKHSVECDKTC